MVVYFPPIIPCLGQSTLKSLLLFQIVTYLDPGLHPLDGLDLILWFTGALTVLMG